jgi:hypothetical protein
MEFNFCAEAASDLFLISGNHSGYDFDGYGVPDYVDLGSQRGDAASGGKGVVADAAGAGIREVPRLWN